MKILKKRFERPYLFGRRLEDYVKMFGLEENVAAQGRLLDVAAGTASFAAEAFRQGAEVTAVDPAFRLSPACMAKQAWLDFRDVMAISRRRAAYFSFDRVPDFGELERCRREALEGFVADYGPGLAQGRYRYGSLPRLPFEDGAFDTVLCGHFLFLYAGDRDGPRGLAFHELAVSELMRVCSREARIYPLVDQDGERPDYFDELMEALPGELRIEQVQYGFLRNSGEVLVCRP